MKAVGIFGGTFDPIHNGHLITALAVKEIRNLEKIILVPSYISPHKKDVVTAPPQHRLQMLKLAIEEIPDFEYSDFELKDESISYTVKTLRHLKKIYNNIELIIGYDNIFDFNKWKNPDEILELSKLVVLKRKLSENTRIKDKYYDSAVFVETPAIEISASEIRERIKIGLPIDFLVPQKVKEYIHNFNLYKEYY